MVPNTRPGDRELYAITKEFSPMYLGRKTGSFTDVMFDVLSIIEPAAAETKLTLLEIAFRWLIHHSALNIKDGGNDGIIIGVSSLQQLEQNLKDVEKGPLLGNVLKALDEAWLMVKPTTSDYWHGDLVYG